MTPKPLEILVCSPSSATLTFLNTMFSSFNTILTSSLKDAESHLQVQKHSPSVLDFIIIDDQTEKHVEDLYTFVHSLNSHALQAVKFIHLYTPTPSASGYAIFDSTTPGVTKMTKPPRTARILQTLAGLKDLPNTITLPPNQSSDVSRAAEDLAAAQRTLFGNVLVAEGQDLYGYMNLAHFSDIKTDNPIAQHLLIKQLQRYNLNVVAASNGEEALAGPFRTLQGKRLLTGFVHCIQSGKLMNQATSVSHYLIIVSGQLFDLPCD